MKISLGSDHAGFHHKEKAKALLISLGHEVLDCGTYSEAPVGYPTYIRPAAQAVASGQAERAIVFGGSGNGEAIVANKVKGVRCGYVWNSQTAELCRKHNDANCIAFGERMITEYIMLECVKIFLTTEFEGGRHTERVREIEDLS
jgi:ribose 5-phosphate isomerase B